jgi:hypothetical protein
LLIIILGRLITITQDGTIAVDVVEFEINRSLEWLNEPRHEHRRHMAVLVLKNLGIYFIFSFSYYNNIGREVSHQEFQQEVLQRPSSFTFNYFWTL